MTAHRWGEPDKDGVRACTRGGCTVRHRTRYQGRVNDWQRLRGGVWRMMPPPPCSGTDAPEAALPEHALDALAGRLGAKAAPSPLEVVRECVAWLENSGRGSDKTYAARLSNALATLEESIRADEREACARVADAARLEAEDMLAAGSHRAEELEAEARAAEEIRDDIRARVKL